MLKLERKDGGLSIGLRDREKWFSSHLLAGLAIALFLHGSALILFDIQSFRTHYSRKPPPPALVETDLTSIDEINEQQIYVQLEEEKKRRRDPLMPIASTPKLAQTLLPPLESHISIQPLLTENSFDHLERAERMISDPETFMLPEVFIQLSGGLAGRRMNWIPPKPKAYDHLLSTIHYLAEVQVDESTGAIFWWHPLSIEGERTLIDEAEALLASLTLTPLGNHGISRGLVEITLMNR